MTMNDIKVSIITASYNYQDYIKETIESVISQTYSNWELVVVDDGSKDNSVEVIKNYCKKDKRIKLYRHRGGGNKGLAETIKLGISKANGNWIAFLESDDRFAPEYLEEKVKIIKKYPEAEFIFSDVEMFGDEKEIEFAKNVFYERLKNYLKPSGFKNLSDKFIRENCIITFSIVMLKKELLKNVDFNSPVKQFLDYYLWPQIISKSKVYYLDKKLTYWRKHPSSYAHNKKGDMRKLKHCVYKFCSTSIKNKITIFLLRLKEIKKTVISIKTGRNAGVVIFGKTLIKSVKHK